MAPGLFADAATALGTTATRPGLYCCLVVRQSTQRGVEGIDPAPSVAYCNAVYTNGPTVQPPLVITPIRTDAPKPDPGATQHPLGPLVYRVTPLRPIRARFAALAVLIGSISLIAIAASVTPHRAGLGSHRQLGLPACSMITLTGYPCPTCGMTTAFAHTVRGQWLAAFHSHPAGFSLALLTIIAGAVSLGVVVTGKVWMINWYRVSPVRVTVGAVLLVLGGWAYKLAVGLAFGTLPLGR